MVSVCQGKVWKYLDIRPRFSTGPIPGYGRAMDGALLEGRVAMVTGGAGGIGRATSARLAAEGATVHVVDVDADRMEATVASVPRAVGHVVDVTDPAAVDALAERDRLALLMREEGLDYDEIAAALDIARSSVGTTLSRARRRLSEHYEALQRGAEGRDHVAG